MASWWRLMPPLATDPGFELAIANEERYPYSELKAIRDDFESEWKRERPMFYSLCDVRRQMLDFIGVAERVARLARSKGVGLSGSVVAQIVEAVQIERDPVDFRWALQSGSWDEVLRETRRRVDSAEQDLVRLAKELGPVACRAELAGAELKKRRQRSAEGASDGADSVSERHEESCTERVPPVTGGASLKLLDHYPDTKAGISKQAKWLPIGQWILFADHVISQGRNYSLNVRARKLRKLMSELVCGRGNPDHSWVGDYITHKGLSVPSFERKQLERVLEKTDLLLPDWPPKG